MSRHAKIAVAFCVAVAVVVGFWAWRQRAHHISPLAAKQPANASAGGVNLVCFGDWGYYGHGSGLHFVARQLARYSQTYAVKFDAALLPGDNIYKQMSPQAEDLPWKTLFEDTFAAPAFSMPFYAAAGNHDYPTQKLAGELHHTGQDPRGRWKFPAKWYRVDLPTNQPLVSVLVLDSNLARLTREEQINQLSWLETELNKTDPDNWVIVMAHHPLFSNGHADDSTRLVQLWGDLFKKHGVDFYICGHDHGLQHLELAGWPMSFIVSAGGGAKLEPMQRADRGPFSRSLHGFFHLNATSNLVVGAFVTTDGEIAHEFVRTPAGVITVIRTTGCEQAAAPQHGAAKVPEED